MIHFVIAGDANFKKFVEQGVKWNTRLGYHTLVYDLGNLGFGEPFQGKVSDIAGAKIPSKPAIIYDAIQKIPDNDFLVWQDADALVYSRIDEIESSYDVGVTVRAPKDLENSLPINAGIIFFRKTQLTIKFIERWKQLCENSVSDQPPLNQLCGVTTKDRGNTVIRDSVKIKVFTCEVYNNFYKKKLEQAKIRHFKTKRRWMYPLEE